MRQGLKPIARAALYRQLAAAIRHKVMPQAVLEILAEDREWFGLGTVHLSDMARQLESGQTLSSAMTAQPRLFTAETARLVQQAERSGRLPAALEVLAADAEREAEGRRVLRQALAWPLTILAVGLSVFYTVAVFVVPQYATFFHSFSAPLPWPTALVAACSGVVQVCGPVFVVLAFLAALSMWLDRPEGKMRGLAAGVACRVRFVDRYVQARFAARLAAWLNAFRDDTQLQRAALAHLGSVAAVPRVRQAAVAVEAAMARGTSMADALRQAPGIPRRVALFARLADRFGPEAEPLAHLLQLSEAEEDEALQRFERGLLQGLYLVIVPGVGLLVASIYLPIFHLGAMI